MKILAALLPVEFACHSKACAPPPVGAGGSKTTGKTTKQMGSLRIDVTGHTNAKLHSEIARLEGMSPKTTGQHRTLKALKAEVAKRPPEFKTITAAQARGDSRPVSHDEFQRLAAEGQKQLDGFADRKSPTKGLDDNWDTVKINAYAEVVKPWGGATIDSHTGKPLPQGEDAYAITVKSGQETVSVPEGASRAEFSRAMDEAKQRFGPILERESHYLGVFHDDDTGRIDIDPVLVVRNRADVDTIGAASHAIGGAYNFKDGNGYWPPHVRG